MFDFDGTLVDSNEIKREAFFTVSDHLSSSQEIMFEILNMTDLGDRYDIFNRYSKRLNEEFKFLIDEDFLVEKYSAICEENVSLAESILGFEIFLGNIPESRKKIREAKQQFIVSDYQKVTRDFAFVIEEKCSSGEIITLVKNIDKELIKNVKIFDVYQGENIEKGKKSIAFNVTFEPKDKTLNEKDIEKVSKKIISVVQSATSAILRS